MDKRQIDEWHVAAQGYAGQIKMEFMQSLMGRRSERNGKERVRPVQGKGGSVGDRQSATPPATAVNVRGELPGATQPGQRQLPGVAGGGKKKKNLPTIL